MKNWKKYLVFVLAMMPIAAVGGWFVSLYQLDLYGEAMREEIIAQLGSVTVLCAVSAVQAAAYAAICAFFGGLMAGRSAFGGRSALRVGR